VKDKEKFYFGLGIFLIVMSVLTYIFKVGYLGYESPFSYLNPFGLGVEKGVLCDCVFPKPGQLHYILTDLTIIYWTVGLLRKIRR